MGEPCRCYNRGRCPFGAECNFDHHCSYCFKFGHTVLNCRKLIVDKDWGKRHFSEGRDNRSPGKSGNGHMAILTMPDIPLLNCFVVENFCCHNLNDIVTPINTKELQHLLQETNYNEDKTQLLIRGFTEGFDLGYQGPTRIRHLSDNIPLKIGTHFDVW